jgi:hypothetical protein
MSTEQGGSGEGRDAEEPGGVGGAAARLTQDTAALVRQEFASFRGELLATAQRAGAGLGLLAGAGLLGLAGLLAGHQTLLRTLESVMPRKRAAAVLTGAYLAGAGVLAACGGDRLRKAGLLSEDVVGQVAAAGRRLSSSRERGGPGGS